MEIARVFGQCSLISARPLTLWGTICYSEINLDLTKCQGTGPIGSLYRGFVISRVRYIENLVKTNLWKKNQSVRYIGV